MITSLDEKHHDQGSMEEAVTIIDTTSRKRKTSFPTCTMCNQSMAIYKCPRCFRETCSLQCCLSHKKQFSCDGNRDVTKYIHLSKFTDSDLRSDYFLLEKISTAADSAHRRLLDFSSSNKRKRSKSSKKCSYPENPNLDAYPKTFQILVKQAKTKNVDLRLMSIGMSKRSRNTSYFDLKSEKLYWRLELEFPSAVVPFTAEEDRISDDILLQTVLDKFFKSPSMRAKLPNYFSNRSDILILLKKEYNCAKEPAYYRLCPLKSLRDNFSNKIIIEYPILKIVLGCDGSKYGVAHNMIEEVEKVC